MDVTLHFGAHRTATTTFQRMLGRSAPSLQGDRIAYWGPKRTRSALFDGLLGPAAGGGMQGLADDRRGKRSLGRIQLALDDAEAGGTKHLLISEENMVGTLRQTLATAKLYPDAGGRAHRLAQVFGPKCRRIGISIRSYDQWWASAIAFGVAKSGPVPSSELTQSVLGQPRRWRHVISELADAFPDVPVYVWSHEVMAARPEIVARTLMGTPMPKLKGTRDWHNAAPTPVAMRGHLGDLGAPIEGVIEREGRFMPFTPAERGQLQADYAEDIAWLRAGEDTRIHYIDDLGPSLGQNPDASGHGEGPPDEGRDRKNRRLA